MTQEHARASVMLVRGVEVPKMAFWHVPDRQDAAVRLTRGVDIPRKQCFGTLHDLDTVVLQRGNSLSGNEPL
eukprot:4353864-Pyramimonas_sp.AAC.1